MPETEGRKSLLDMESGGGPWTWILGLGGLLKVLNKGDWVFFGGENGEW